MSEMSWPLTSAARRLGDAPAVVSADRTYPFVEYETRVHAVAGALERAGIGPGDRLGILSLPSSDYPLLMMGCFQLGAVVCPLNTRVPRHSLAECLHRINAKALLVDDFFAMARLGHVPTLRIADALASGVERPQTRMPGPAQPCTIVFTSGSTDEPKAALHTLANHSESARASNENIRVSAGDRWLLSLPLFHVSGISVLFRCLWGGGAVVVPQSGEPLEESIPRYGVTHISLVATQLFRLLQSETGRAALAGLKAILLGGSAMPASLIRQAHALKLPIHTSYGLTETASQLTSTRAGDSLAALLTSGRPLRPGTVAISREREILVRGATLFRGYVEGDEVTRPLTPDGWFATGDLGELDGDGNLRVLGRKDNMFISGGENVQPEEVERWLCNIDGVVQAVVVPAPSAEFGSRPVAFVRVDGPEKMRPALFAAYLAEHLPRYKIPRLFLSWPRERGEGAMKVDRARFKKLARRRDTEHDSSEDGAG